MIKSTAMFFSPNEKEILCIEDIVNLSCS